MRTAMATSGGLIIGADGLGTHPRTDAGIVEAYEHGILTSAGPWRGAELSIIRSAACSRRSRSPRIGR
jgi:hypothetical protein